MPSGDGANERGQNRLTAQWSPPQRPSSRPASLSDPLVLTPLADYDWPTRRQHLKGTGSSPGWCFGEPSWPPCTDKSSPIDLVVVQPPPVSRGIEPLVMVLRASTHCRGGLRMRTMDRGEISSCLVGLRGGSNHPWPGKGRDDGRRNDRRRTVETYRNGPDQEVPGGLIRGTSRRTGRNEVGDN